MPLISGSNIGTVYDNDEGKGLAAILPNQAFNKALDISLFKQKQRAKDQAEGAKLMADAAPDVKWTPYVNQIQERYNKLTQASAQAMSQYDIPNIWKSNHQAAVALRQEYSKLGNLSNAVNALYTDYEKRLAKVNANRDDYTEASVNSLLSFPDQYSLDDIAAGYTVGPGGSKTAVGIPNLKFKQPEQLYSGYYAAHKDLREMAVDGVVSDETIQSHAQSYLTAEVNEGARAGMEQSYNTLLQKARGIELRMIPMGVNDPQRAALQVQLDQISDVIIDAQDQARQMNAPEYMGFGVVNMKSMLAPDLPDINSDIASMVDAGPMKKWTGEEGPVDGRIVRTTTKRLDTKSGYARRAAESYVGVMKAKGLLNRQDYLASLGIKGSPTRVEEQMVDYIEQRIISEADSLFERTSISAGETSAKFGSESLNESANLWYEYLTSGDAAKSTDAARYLLGSLGVTDPDAIVQANFGTLPDQDILPEELQGVEGLSITLRDKKGSRAAMGTYISELENLVSDGEFWGDASPEVRTAYAKYLNKLDPDKFGNTLFIPVESGNLQQMRKLHDRVVDGTERLYSPFGGFTKAQDSMQKSGNVKQWGNVKISN